MVITLGKNSRPCSRLTPKHPASHPPTYSLRNSPRFSLHRAPPNWRILRTLPISMVTTTTGRCCLRSEEHTSELQSLRHLVCRLLLEKKKDKHYMTIT